MLFMRQKDIAKINVGVTSETPCTIKQKTDNTTHVQVILSTDILLVGKQMRMN